jgi:asparagine synthase (glutamine-hydrolysing)
MCGVTGVVDLQTSASSISGPTGLRGVIEKMTATLARRGPDDSGIWVNSEKGIALGHRRLSILELSDLGHQPIVSPSGRYVMTFNGEIYNFVELAAELGKFRSDFAASSDTQVMLAAFEQWGVIDAISHFDGMFAFLCFDQQQNTLHIARDRLGEKPLYFGYHEKKLLFSSELKAMQAIFRNKPNLDRKALTLFLRHGYVPAPYSIYQNIFKLPPAAMINFDLKQLDSLVNPPKNLLSQIQYYWKLTEADESHQVRRSDFEPLLESVVERQMRSDVALGAFLSGGVDSSTIVALMQKASDRRVRTFSIGFEVEEFNEAPYARDVAQHLNTAHYEKILSATEVIELIPDLAQVYDEPFGDSSQLPTILVSKLAREHVTVCLSGDGGDELFGGYQRYQWAQKVWRSFSWMPLPTRRIISQLLLLIASADVAAFPTPVRGKLRKCERLAAMLTEHDRQYFYRTVISSETNPQDYILGGSEPKYKLTSPMMQDEQFLHQMMHLDIHNYLPDDILTKVDRASMYSSLELRTPLLDHNVVTQAWRLKSYVNNDTGNTKVVLRDILYKHVPKKLIERPKRGFGIPLENWLRGPLKEWAQSYMNVSRLKQEGVFQADETVAVWNDFLNGKPGSHHFIWNVIMFQLWSESWH